MQCPRCRHENPAGMKFCGECAAPLSLTCPSCGAANPPEHKFCGQCAAPLRSSSAPKAATPEPYTPKHLAEKILTSKAALARLMVGPCVSGCHIDQAVHVS
jgi:hypothetical protein